jgi:hypothetical protein
MGLSLRPFAISAVEAFDRKDRKENPQRTQRKPSLKLLLCMELPNYTDAFQKT